MAPDKLIQRILSGTADASIRFGDLCHLLESLGFEKRIRGSQHLFRKSGVEEMVNLQRAGTNAKPYSGPSGPGYNFESWACQTAMIKYEVIIYWSTDDQVFIAEVPELPGCMAHGATQDEALHNAQDAIRLWLDTAKEFGDPIPEPKGRRLILA